MSAALISIVAAASSFVAGPQRPVAPRVHAPWQRGAASNALRMLTLDDFLCEEDGQAELSTILLALTGACKTVASKIATASCDSTSCFNEIDETDEMLAIDLLAEEVLFDALTKTGLVETASSESDGVMRRLTMLPPMDAADVADGGSGGHHRDGDAHHDAAPPFSVALDPLDASSIIDSNFAVGTIFAVWRAPSFIGKTGRELVAAGTCTYGPRTAITLALAARPAVHEFLLIGDRWLQSNVYSSMQPEGRLFAPGNLRATASRPGYAELVDYWQSRKYTLRYTGGLVPDVTQLIVKGKGVFTSVPEAGERPRLRLCYEAAPMAFLVEKAGGASSDGARSLLDLEITEPLVRTQVALGSPDEVRRFDEMVGPLDAE